MADAPALFGDGKAYERLMGRWSRLAGDPFLDWLALPKGLKWLDVGCGNGEGALAAGGAAVDRGPSHLHRGFVLRFRRFLGFELCSDRTGRPSDPRLPADKQEKLKAQLRKQLPTGADGRITYKAWANAVKGGVPD